MLIFVCQSFEVTSLHVSTAGQREKKRIYLLVEALIIGSAA